MHFQKIILRIEPKELLAHLADIVIDEGWCEPEEIFIKELAPTLAEEAQHTLDIDVYCYSRTVESIHLKRTLLSTGIYVPEIYSETVRQSYALRQYERYRAQINNIWENANNDDKVTTLGQYIKKHRIKLRASQFNLIVPKHWLPVLKNESYQTW